jgi:3-isopropylmalate dehydrogenase
MKRVAVAGGDEALVEAVKVVRALRAPLDFVNGECDAMLGQGNQPVHVRVQPARLLDARLCPLRDKREVDVDFIVYGEVDGADRVCQAAFEAARRPGRRRRVALAGESLRDAFRNAKPSDLTAQELSVGAAVEQMVRAPEKLDIIVVDRVHADVLGSLGVAVAGGAGVAATAWLGPCPMFSGQSVGAFLAAAMMLDALGLLAEAARLDAAVRRAVGEDRTTRELGGRLSIDEFGDVVRRYL